MPWWEVASNGGPDEMEEIGFDYHVRERRTLPRATVACYIERGVTPRIAYREDYIVRILNLEPKR